VTNTSTGAPEPVAPTGVIARLSAFWGDHLARPVRAVRRAYVPLLMVYFAYGALGIVDVSRDMWVKESLSLSPAELAGVAVWLSLPWTIKMVFGQLVDGVTILGSRRHAYVLIGAAFTASGLIVLAGAAGGWFTRLPPNGAYVLGAVLMVFGAVIQDVVADAMSSEVVDRVDGEGNPRPDSEIRTDLAMVQVLGRLALGIGILSVAGLSGWLAQHFPREQVFLFGLVVPLISVTGALFVRPQVSEAQPVDWRILGGGLAFGAFVVGTALGEVPYAQELVFVVSMTVVLTMLHLVTRDIDPKTRRAIVFATIIIFAFRATPGVGDGYFWWTLDVLKFDEAFYGILRQTSAIIAIGAMWFFSRQLTEYSVTTVLFWIAVAGTVLSIPNIGLYYGLADWTQANFGFGARTIAVVDAATTSPFADLSMIPMLTLIAYYAPEGRRATWFALMASLMNLALVAGQLQTKYLNHIFTVGRGDYGELGGLLITATVIGFVVPVAVILMFRKRV
jgi:MFS family permease